MPYQHNFSQNNSLCFKLFVILVTLSFSQGLIASPPDKKVSAQEFVDLQEGDRPYEGYRRAHAKGICISGEFRSNGSLEELSIASLFESKVTPFDGRFSIAGGNPEAEDLASPVRSLALNFALSYTQQWRIAMNTPPVMAVSNPHDFYQQIVAIKQGPEAVQEFFSKHSEAKDFMAWRSKYKPSKSFSDEIYHSINAFYLHSQKDNKQAVRWKMVPVNAASHQKYEGPDALQLALKQQLKTAPIVYDWVFTLAAQEDDENNPAIKWPETRPNITAGQIVITSWQPQLEGNCHSVNFDPLVLPKGLSATEDPILRARSAAYAESYRRRAIEELNGALDGERND